MDYRILINPTLPAHMQRIAAGQAIAAQEARKHQQEQQRDAEARRKADLAAEMKRHEARWQREEKETAKRKQQEADCALTASLRTDFFAKNPAANEADFARLLPQLRDAFILAQMNAASARRGALARSREEYRPL